jgi:hypothetical protein
MSSIAIGGLGRIFKKPALPGEAPQTKKIEKIKIIYKKITNESKVV